MAAARFPWRSGRKERRLPEAGSQRGLFGGGGAEAFQKEREGRSGWLGGRGLISEGETKIIGARGVELGGRRGRERDARPWGRQGRVKATRKENKTAGGGRKGAGGKGRFILIRL